MFFLLLFSYQSFKELPKLLDHSRREGAPLSAAVRTDMQPGDSHTTGNLEVQRSLPQRLVFREADKMSFSLISSEASEVCLRMCTFLD